MRSTTRLSLLLGAHTSSEEDEVIIKGVSENKYALGYVGLAYYAGANGHATTTPGNSD